ncbi:MAG: hypothetical protein NTW37_09705, partial [Proteobacteria bacterium]|nr:hypothetical protein [Pseudomonadota bacterium]
MSRRTEILDEMGLSPRWTLREGFARTLPTAAPGTATGTVAAADDAPSPDTSAAPAAPAAVDAQGRATAIMQMDWTPLAEAVAGCTACPLA